jgi:hypothetical protein
MLPIPNDVAAAFMAVQEKRGVPSSFRSDFTKWLRYFLDFCSKHHPPASKSDQVRLFVDKLKSKGQSTEKQEQAAYAVSLYFESQRQAKMPLSSRKTDHAVVHEKKSDSIHRNNPVLSETPDLLHPALAEIVGRRVSVATSKSGNRFNEWRCMEQSGSPAWDQIIGKLAAEIKVRHYSRKTLKTYADWGRKFQSYLRNKPPEELSAADVKEP